MRIGIPGYDRNGQSTQTHSQIWKIRSQDCQKTRAGLEAIRISSGSGLKGADIPRGGAPCGAWNGLGDYSAAGGNRVTQACVQTRTHGKWGGRSTGS